MFKLKGKFVRSLNGFLDGAFFKPRPLKFPCTRLLYTPASMGIPQFLANRNLPVKTLQELEEFKQKMAENLASPDSNYLFVGDDLRKLIKIANTKEDLDLLKKLIERFLDQHKTIRFQTFSFGPEIMRVYYILQEPKKALELINSDKFILLKEVTSFVLLMDLLYENQLYEDAIKVYDLVYEGQLFGVMPSPLITLLFANCYKLNTPESYQKAQNAWAYMKDKRIKIFYRTNWFAAMLAFLQDDPVAALELSQSSRSAVMFSIQVMALIKLQRFQDALNLLMIPLNATEKRTYLTQDAIEFILGEFQQNGGEENRKQLLKVIAEFSTFNLIGSETLDQILCSPIERKNETIPRIRKPIKRDNVALT